MFDFLLNQQVVVKGQIGVVKGRLESSAGQLPYFVEFTKTRFGWFSEDDLKGKHDGSGGTRSDGT